LTVRTLLAGAGCGVLFTLSLTTQLLAPDHLLIYSQLLPVTSVYLAVLIDMMGFALLGALAWWALLRIPLRNPVWPFLYAGIFMLEAHGAATLANRDASHRVWAGILIALLLLFIGLRFRNYSRFELLARAGNLSMAIWGFSILWMAPDLAYLAQQTSKHESPGFSREGKVTAASGARIVWILFDELSYNQAYEHRFPGLALPNFDRLRAQSTTFSNVTPAGYSTRIAIPSMFLGRPISDLRSSATGEPAFYMDDRHGWEAFDPRESIFGTARGLGLKSGIVGYYNPYCRILQDWVDDCYWLGSDGAMIAFQPNLNPRNRTLRNAAFPALRWLHVLMPNLVREPNGDTANHQEEYREAVKRARRLILRSDIQFAFLHIPLPHPPGIYDRVHHRFSDHGSYIDNLALADLALGELLDTLQGTANWGRTTLVVSGDHSWRIPLWEFEFTDEERQAARGGFDPRPVLEVRLPGNHAGELVTRKFEARNLAQLLNGMMHGWIHTTDDVVLQMEPQLSAQRAALN
jgi:sulfatase-like protein